MFSFLTIIFMHLAKDYNPIIYLFYIISIFSAISLILILINACLNGIKDYYLIIAGISSYIAYYFHFIVLICASLGVVNETLKIVLGSSVLRIFFLILFFSTGYMPYILLALGFILLGIEDCKKKNNWF